MSGAGWYRSNNPPPGGTYIKKEELVERGRVGRKKEELVERGRAGRKRNRENFYNVPCRWFLCCKTTPPLTGHPSFEGGELGVVRGGVV